MQTSTSSARRVGLSHSVSRLSARPAIVHTIRPQSSSSSSTAPAADTSSSTGSAIKAITKEKRPPLRVFLLPLSKKHASTSSIASNETLFYWHVSQRLPRAGQAPKTPADPADVKKDVSATTTAIDGDAEDAAAAIPKWPDFRDPASWPQWGLDKASTTWLEWGTPPPKPEENGGKRKYSMEAKYWVWRNGEWLMDRIGFEEWALKTIHPNVSPYPASILPSAPPPTLASPATSQGDGDKAVVAKASPEEIEKHVEASGYRIPLLIPPSFIRSKMTIPEASRVIPTLQGHLTSRVAHHKNYFWRCLGLLPVLAPIGLLPVVPNLPGFYVAWRAWSHWRAWKGGEWLLDLVKKGRLEVNESEPLGQIIESSEGSDSTSDPDIFLPADKLPLLKDAFKFAPNEIVDIKRAVIQAEQRLQKQRKELETKT